VSDADLFAQQEANRRRSAWLVGGFILFFAWVGFGGDLGLYLWTADAPPEAYHHVVPFLGILTTAFAAGLCWYAWRTGPRRVLWSAGAAELVEAVTPEQRQLVNVVEEMAIAGGMPRPKIWLVPDQDLNAFATGHRAADAHIAVTQGLVARLSRDELQGVVAHELAHIRTSAAMTLLAGMLGAMALVSDGLGRYLRMGGRVGGGGGSRGGGKGKGNPLAVVILVAWLFTLLLAPVVSRMLAMAVNRKREYLADATGVQLTRNPRALADALEKLDLAGSPASIARGSAHLIVDSAERRLSDREGFIGDIFVAPAHPADRAAWMMAFGRRTGCAATAVATRHRGRRRARGGRVGSSSRAAHFPRPGALFHPRCPASLLRPARPLQARAPAHIKRALLADADWPRGACPLGCLASLRSRSGAGVAGYPTIPR
jgi:heat shock protein HtpX